MPMTLWSDIVGYCCVDCGKWATHWYARWYGNVPVCCTCHQGQLDAYMEAQAIEMNTRFQKGLPLEDICEELTVAEDKEWTAKAESSEAGGYLGTERTAQSLGWMTDEWWSCVENTRVEKKNE